MAANLNPYFKLPVINSSGGGGYQGSESTGMFVSNSNQETGTMETMMPQYHGNKPKFPKIVLRDMIGRELDTDTAYQRAIYEAKYKFAQGDYPQTAQEWRLPHAPLPARPDLTRTAPPLALQRAYKTELKKLNRLYNSYPQPEFSEAIESDKGYENLRWSLQQAGTLPALAGAELIKSSSAREPSKTYMPFVGTAPVVNKHLTETDKRDAEYTVPDLCYGCTKGTGLCYGCDKSSGFHYHHDKVARTGGGFVYFKHDKPYGMLPAKNPANWNVEIPESDGRHPLLAIRDGQKQTHLRHGHGRGVFAHPQWLPRQPKGLPPTSYVFYDDVNQPDFRKFGTKVSVVQLQDGTKEAFVNDLDEDGNPVEGRRQVTFVTDPDYDDSGVGGTLTSGGITVDEDGTIRFTGLPSGTSYDQSLATVREGGSDGEGYGDTDDEQRKSREKTGTSDGTSTSSKPKSRGLYKTPPAFKLKSSEKKVTIAADPFSKDREYDIPTGDGIHIKKSDKPLTDFDEFNFGEGEWEQPKFDMRSRTNVPPGELKRPPVVVSNERKTRSDVTNDVSKAKVTVKKESPPAKPKEKKEKPVKVRPRTPDSEVNIKAEIPRVPSPTIPEEPVKEPEKEPKEPKEPQVPVKKERKPRQAVVKKERKQREPPVRKTRRESVKEVIEEEPEPKKKKVPTATLR